MKSIERKSKKMIFYETKNTKELKSNGLDLEFEEKVP
jgi:hypothetical protein